MLHLLLFIFWSHFSEEPLFGAALYHSAHRRACLLAGRDDFLPHDLERGTSGLKRPLTLFRPGFFRPSGTGGVQKPPPVTLKPLTLWPPSLHRIVYALILTATDTVMSL